MKITSAPDLEPGQDFQVDGFRPQDALGLARLFMAVYGPSYPVDSYYDPDWLVSAAERGDLHSVVARTPSGDIVGHGSFYRSSPPNPRLLEYGQMIVHRDYRQTLAAFKVYRHAHRVLLPKLDLDGVFGETVTNRAETQKLSAIAAYLPVAMELALMPEEAYEAEQSARGRVSCAAFVLPRQDRPQVLHVPPRYRELVDFILADSGLSRSLESQARTPEGTTRLEGRTFGPAGVTRVNVFEVGLDFPARMAAWEREAREEGAQVHQVFVALDRPESAWGLEQLQAMGYFPGGLMPWWFGPDALLMQKLDHAPDLDRIQLAIPKSRDILARCLALGGLR